MYLQAALLRLRPSNLIILFALPFIVWLFVTSPDYGRSLSAIVGVEPGSAAQLPGFFLAAMTFAGGIAAAFWTRAGRRNRAMTALAASLVGAVLLGLTAAGLPFLHAVVANGVDPFTSPLVVPGETPRRLTVEAAAMVTMTSTWLFAGLALLTAILTFLARGGRARRPLTGVLIALHGLGLIWLVLFAHLGFAVGLVVTIRAAMTAYGLAVVLALVWVGLLQLHYRPRSALGFALATAILLAGALWQFAAPKLPYTLVGNAAGTVGIVAGTPKGLVDSVRFGAFPDAPATDIAVRTFAAPAEAATAVTEGQISGALLPGAELPAGTSAFWQTAVLPPSRAALGVTLLVAAIASGLLAGCGWLHQRHPLAIGSEFIVDTLRGIPMLVIILYIGLPLAGIVKSASGGFIDPPNMLRGIVAMAIAYSAYLAEIFRAGINAVPTGQIEAARSLGLSRWSTARHVILPQAFRIVIPPMGNEFIAILKDTSLLSILSIRDVTQRMREFQSASFLPFAPYNTAAVVYVLLTLVAASLVARVEHRFRNQQR